LLTPSQQLFALAATVVIFVGTVRAQGTKAGKNQSQLGCEGDEAVVVPMLRQEGLLPQPPNGRIKRIDRFNQ